MKFLRSIRAVAAIEFAMLLPIFLVFVTVLIEILILIYQSMVVEYVNSLSGQYASSFSYKEGYETKYRESLERTKTNVAFFLSDETKYDLRLEFCKDLDELIANTCTGSNDDNKIIIYKLQYKPTPLFIGNWLEKYKLIGSNLAFYSERYKIEEEENG